MVKKMSDKTSDPYGSIYDQMQEDRNEYDRLRIDRMLCAVCTVLVALGALVWDQLQLSEPSVTSLLAIVGVLLASVFGAVRAHLLLTRRPRFIMLREVEKLGKAADVKTMTAAEQRAFLHQVADSYVERSKALGDDW